MNYEVIDESLKDILRQKAIKNNINSGWCFVRYGGCMYLVDFDKDKIFRQHEYK